MNALWVAIWLGVVFYLETILRLATEGQFIVWGLLFSVLFGLVRNVLRGDNSPYSLYYTMNYPNFSVHNLGLLTYMRIDALIDRESDVTLPEYVDAELFHTYYMTVSGHMFYNFKDNFIAVKNRQAVAELTYSNEAKAYLATQVELDLAMAHLLTQLEMAGKLDNTLIAISSDHYPYGLSEKALEELNGGAIEKNFEIFRNAFILYTPGMTSEIIDAPVSSLDILPTLSNLFGLEYDSSLMMGTDIGR